MDVTPEQVLQFVEAMAEARGLPTEEQKRIYRRTLRTLRGAPASGGGQPASKKTARKAARKQSRKSRKANRQ